MSKATAANERIKWKYLRYLKEANGKSEASIDAVAAAIARFQESTKDRDFRAFHKEQAIAFKNRLAKQCNARTGKTLSKSTIDSALRALRAFFHWLAREPGYRHKLEYSDAHYFNLSAKDQEVARAKRSKRVPSLEQLQTVLSPMPADTDIEKRESCRDSLHYADGRARRRSRDAQAQTCRHGGRRRRPGRPGGGNQTQQDDPALVFPVGNEALAIAREWVGPRYNEHLAGPGDPLFPKTRVARDNEGYFRAVGLAQDGWASAQPVRKIFKRAFRAAGLPPINPHAVRDMLTQLGERICRTPEEFKAWSQNLGHSAMLTTFTSYGVVSPPLLTLIRELGEPDRANDIERSPADVEQRLKRLEAIAAAKIGG